MLDADYFLVKHLKTGKTLYVYAENEKGFLWKVPFREAGLMIAKPAQYILKKPQWKRIPNEQSENEKFKRF